ncbi:MAG: DNA translocase FtsK [Anaerolineaceae bacterium]|nr:DNA translocase FtsK [Anaerolineaceae bacterium]
MAKAPARRSKSRNTQSSIKRRTSTKKTIPKRRAPARKTTSTPARRKPKPKSQRKGMSTDRKLDLIGVAIGLLGLLSLLGLLTEQKGSVTTWWVKALYQSVGWGAYLLPILLVLIGLWLVIRNLEKLPAVSIERILGTILVFLNLLVWVNMLARKGWQSGGEALGGGAIGATIERLLVNGLGTSATVIVLIAWLLIGLILALDLSLVDLFRRIIPLGKKLGEYLERAYSEWKISRTSKTEHQVIPANRSEDLPSSFHPIRNLSSEPSGAITKSKSKERQRKKQETTPTEEEPQISIGIKITKPETTWELPSVKEILDPSTPMAIQDNVDQETAKLIEQTLASFGVPGHIVEIQRGPTVTQFGLEPDFIETRYGRTRVRVNKITALTDDLALALAASRIRIQAPVPGKSYVGIEVPNPETSRVSLIDLIKSSNFKRITSPLRFALGKDVSGKSVSVDLSSLPHLLIAGTTGSGKSVCINSILTSFLLFNTPANLRFVLVDPKRVELTGYNGIPHLLAPTVTDAERVINALQWMAREMDSRYYKFSKAGVRNIHEFNVNHPQDTLPYLVVVIDELADLMMLAPDETERSITRLAQLARATGIHLILATQRPSTDVVTGLIKANFPARIAFAVASGVDSRVILDQPGAERLLGRGDMLYQAPDASAPVRLQGVFVSESETRRLISYWRQAATRHPAKPTSQELPIDDSLPKNVPLQQTALWDEEPEEEGDVLLHDAIDLVRRQGRASITMLQRRLRIGYTRAARLVDAMEEKGIISPKLPHTQTREVLDYGPAAPPAEE